MLVLLKLAGYAPMLCFAGVLTRIQCCKKRLVVVDAVALMSLEDCPFREPDILDVSSSGWYDPDNDQ